MIENFSQKYESNTLKKYIYLFVLINSVAYFNASVVVVNSKVSWGQFYARHDASGAKFTTPRVAQCVLKTRNIFYFEKHSSLGTTKPVANSEVVGLAPSKRSCLVTCASYNYICVDLYVCM
jgi:hypothetical protein